MEEKCTDSSYNHPHKKNAKSFAKALCKALDIKPHICTKFTASQLHSFTASQLHSFTASQLRPYYAQIKQSNTAKFSHTTRTRPNSRLCAFFIALQIGIDQNTTSPNKELTYEKTFKDFNNGCGSADNRRIIYNL
ncbi:hypothetical protein [Treponema denticola]|uniref:hypothetical protein n=1 Tax=Treponema denticola TaxID=158 RepID=UPI0020A25D29|nr:hypothetical protein [Treponema denticola]